MTARPFSIRCSAGGLVDEIRISIQYNLPGPAPAELSAIEQLFQHFTTLAAHGGLAGRALPAAQSTLTLRSYHVGGLTANWVFSDAKIDPAARLVIENLVHHIHVTLAPVDALDIETSLSSFCSQTIDAPPGRNVRLPFDFSVEPEQTRVVIEVDYASTVVTGDPGAHFIHLWDAWFHVAAAGGFEVGAREAFADSTWIPEEPESHQHGLMFWLDDVTINPQAFDSLLNAFANLHVHTASLEWVCVS